MKCKALALALVAIFLVVACKARNISSTLRADGDLAAGGGLDVNDVSILFPKTGDGQFYPNVDIKTVWPIEAFSSLIAYTQTKKADGIEFGQFILPPNYAAKVNQFNLDPTLAPVANSDFEKNAKDISDRTRPTQKCDAQGQNCVPVPAEIRCDAYVNNAPMRCVDDSAALNFSHHRANIANYEKWRIVSLRMDLCAGAHKAEIKDQCETEFRLIAQPYGDYAPVPPPPGGVAPELNTATTDVGPYMFDVSAHLLFKVGTYDMQTGKITTADGTDIAARDLVQDLQDIKAASLTSVNVSTNGKPLGVHPGLKAEAANGGGALGKKLLDVIGKYTRFSDGRSKLTNVTSMHLAGPAKFDSSEWVFFQGVIKNLTWHPTPITGTTDIWSIRTKSTQGTTGRMFPPPQLQPQRQTINKIFSIAPGQQLPAGIADLPALFDNPGRLGDANLSVNVRSFADPNKVLTGPAPSVKNTDCVSCHMTSTRSFEWTAKSIDSTTGQPRPSLYIPPVGTTAYLDPEVIPRVDYQLRNFGYFLSPPYQPTLPPGDPGLGIFNFPGLPRIEKPSVMNRVATESAELVNLINTRILNVPNPGFICQGEDPQKAYDTYVASMNPDQMVDLFSSDLQRSIRRDASAHARISDCLLFESYRPGVTFETCAQRCASTFQSSLLAKLLPGTYSSEQNAQVATIEKDLEKRQISVSPANSNVVVYNCPSTGNSVCTAKEGSITYGLEIKNATTFQIFRSDSNSSSIYTKQP